MPPLPQTAGRQSRFLCETGLMIRAVNVVPTATRLDVASGTVWRWCCRIPPASRKAPSRQATVTLRGRDKRRAGAGAPVCAGFHRLLAVTEGIARRYAVISVATSSSADTIGSQAPSADLLPWSVHIVPAPIPWADFSPLRLRVVHFATKSSF